MTTNFYAVLGLDRRASAAEVRERFRVLARERHPDRFRGATKVEAEREFQAITQAYNVLRDPARRRQHDQSLVQLAGGVRTGGDQRDLGQVYLQQGIRSFRAEDWAAAVSAFKQATTAAPSNARCWHHLALACSREPARSSLAMTAIRKACDLEPENSSYLKLAGDLFAHSGLTLRAEKFYNQALQWGGADAEIELSLRQLGRHNL